MARSHLRYTVTDRAGNAVQNALVHVYVKGTVTPVGDMFAAESGGAAITTLTANNQGEIEAWFTTGKFVDLNVTDNGNTAFYPSAPGAFLDWTPYTETVEVNPTPEQLVKVINEKLNVQDPRWGVLGDGSDDGARILTALNAGAGGIVFFPPPPSGAYKTSVNLTPLANTIVRGAGLSLVTLKPTGTNHVFYVLNKPNVVIEDLTIDLQKSVTADGGLTGGQTAIRFDAKDATGCPGAIVRRVRAINGWYQGIRFNSDTITTFPLTAEVTDCEVSGMGTTGIQVYQATKSRVLRNDTHANGSPGIHVQGGLDTIVRGNSSYDHLGNGSLRPHGISVNGQIIGAVVEGNHCWNNTAPSGGGVYGVLIGDGVTEFVVDGNLCEANDGNVNIDVAIGGNPAFIDTKGVVSNNTCLRATRSYGLHTNRADGLVVVGNLCAYNEQDGFQIFGRNITVAGNQAYLNGDSGYWYSEAGNGNGPHFHKESNTSYGNNTNVGLAPRDYLCDVLTNGPVYAHLAGTGSPETVHRAGVGSTFRRTDGGAGTVDYLKESGVGTDTGWVASRRADVIATASLPAAGAAQDGRIVIEDAGAGDRNLIVYVGGQRFRIDGGAAV